MLIAWQKLFRQMQKPRKWSDWSVSVTVSDSATWPFKSQFVHEFFQHTKASSSLSGSSGAPCKQILSDSRFQVWSRKRAIQQAAYRDSYAAMRRSAFWAETGFGKKRLMAAIRCFASGSWIWGNMTCRKDPGRSTLKSRLCHQDTLCEDCWLSEDVGVFGVFGVFGFFSCWEKTTILYFQKKNNKAFTLTCLPFKKKKEKSPHFESPRNVPVSWRGGSSSVFQFVSNILPSCQCHLSTKTEPRFSSWSPSSLQGFRPNFSKIFGLPDGPCSNPQPRWFPTLAKSSPLECFASPGLTLPNSVSTSENSGLSWMDLCIWASRSSKHPETLRWFHTP